MGSFRDVDMRHFAALVAVVDEGSFARAAAATGFTQSAVSQQIAQLEKAAGIAIFDRPKGPRPAVLTAAGHVVLEHARSMLTRTDRMGTRLDLMARGLAGRLVVGTFQSASAELLPNIIGRMRGEVPEVDVEMHETDDVGELLREVLNDTYDLAFTVDQDPDDRIEIDVLGEDRFVVLAPAGARPDGDGTVSAAEVNRHPLIGQPDSQTAQQMIDARLAAAGVTPVYAFRFQNNAAVQSLVRSGMGWAVMPSLAVDPSDRATDVLVLEPPLEPRTIQLIRRAGRSLLPAADQFRAIANDVAQQLLS